RVSRAARSMVNKDLAEPGSPSRTVTDPRGITFGQSQWPFAPGVGGVPMFSIDSTLLIRHLMEKCAACPDDSSMACGESGVRVTRCPTAGDMPAAGSGRRGGRKATSAAEDCQVDTNTRGNLQLRAGRNPIGSSPAPVPLLILRCPRFRNPHSPLFPLPG